MRWLLGLVTAVLATAGLTVAAVYVLDLGASRVARRRLRWIRVVATLQGATTKG